MILKYEIRYYRARSGKIPFHEWLKRFKDKPVEEKIDIRLDRLRLGNLGPTRFVGKGVQELKLNFGPGYRIYFGMIHNAVILLLCGGDKSSQSKDIKRAHKFWIDYRSRS